MKFRFYRSFRKLIRGCACGEMPLTGQNCGPTPDASGNETPRSSESVTDEVSCNCLPTFTIRDERKNLSCCGRWSVQITTTCKRSGDNPSWKHKYCTRFRRSAQSLARRKASTLPRGAHIIDQKTSSLTISYIVLPKRYSLQLFDGSPLLIVPYLLTLGLFLLLLVLLLLALRESTAMQTLDENITTWQTGSLSAVVATLGLLTAALAIPVTTASTLSSSDQNGLWMFQNNLFRKTSGILLVSFLVGVTSIVALTVDSEVESHGFIVDIMAHGAALVGAGLVFFLLMRLVMHLHHYVRYAPR